MIRSSVLHPISASLFDPAPEAIAPGAVRHRDPRVKGLPSPPFPGYAVPPRVLGEAPRPLRARPRFTPTALGATISVAIEPGTSLYGTGEVAGPLRRNGRRTRLWNTDAFGYDDRTPSLYQSHPWVLAVRPDGSSFGMLVETTRATGVDLTRAIEFACEGPSPPAVIIERDHPADVVRALAELTGLPPLPARWTIGYHQCRWSYEPASRVRALAREFRARRIPCDVIWLDIDYMDSFRCFTIDRRKFGNGRGLCRELARRGFRTVWMIDPGVKVDPRYPVYARGRDRGYFVRRADGSEFHGEVWPGPCAFPDFTRAAVRSWWGLLYRPLLDMGADGFWNDMNEPAVFKGPGKSMPRSCVHRADREIGGRGDHARYHNIYGMQMIRATREGVARLRPDRRPFVLTRSNFIGGQRYGATWTGDNTSDWRHLRWSISMALNLGLSGQPFAGPDIGGFIGDADPRLFSRWMGIGALLPFARGHSIKSSRPHEPWAFGPDATLACRLALERRYRLLPYLYSLFDEASRTGMPVVRPLFFADPADNAQRDVPDSFLLGGDVLVEADVQPPGTPPAPRRRPRGLWRSFEPASAVHAALPRLFLRAGAILPLGPFLQHTGEHPLDPLTLVVSLDQTGAAAGTLYEDAGDGYEHLRGEYLRSRFTARRGRSGVVIECAGREGNRSPPARSTRAVVLGSPGVPVALRLPG